MVKKNGCVRGPGLGKKRRKGGKKNIRYSPMTDTSPVKKKGGLQQKIKGKKKKKTQSNNEKITNPVVKPRGEHRVKAQVLKKRGKADWGPKIPLT